MSIRLAGVVLRLVACLSVAAGWSGAGARADDAAPAPRGPTPELPELMVQIGHTQPVTSVAFSPDATYVVTGSKDKTARLWEAATGRVIRRFVGHEHGVTSVAVSSDGAFVLTGSYDKSARLWEAATGKEVRRFVGHGGPIWSVAFSPDGARVLTGSEDATARVWERGSDRSQTLAGHTGPVWSVAFSPDGTRVLTGSGDTTARLWDAASGANVQTYRGHTGAVTAVAFAMKGAYVVTGSADRTARLFAAGTGAPYQTYQGKDRLGKDADVVSSVAASPDGKYVLTGSWNHDATLWEAVSGKPSATFTGHVEAVHAVAFSPDGTRVLTGSVDRSARVWAMPARGADRVAEALVRYEGRTDAVTSVAFSPDGARILTASDDGTATLWETAGGKAARRFRGHENEVNALALSSDARLVLTGGGYDVIATGIIRSGGDTSARLFDASTEKEVRRFVGHKFSVTSVAISPDAKTVATGSMDMTARLWDAATGTPLVEWPHPGAVYAVAFSPVDGGSIATGAGDGIVRLWSTSTRALVRTFTGHGLGVTSLAFSPDGKTLLTGSKDGDARLWDVSSERVKVLSRHKGWVTSVAFAPDGRHVLTASADQNNFAGDDAVILWDTAGKEIRRLAQPTPGVRSIAFSPDGKRILTGSADGMTRIYDAESGQPLCALVSFRDGRWAVTTPEGRYDASNGGDVDGLHWVLGREVIELTQLKQRYYEPRLLARMLGLSDEPLAPVAAFTEADFPDVKVEQQDGRLTIHLANRGGGIGPVRIKVNGNEITADARAPNADASAATLKVEADVSNDPNLVPGARNRIEVVAFNARGDLASRGREPPPVEKEGEPPKPELWAVVAGIMKYRGAELNNLKFPVKDATDFAAALELAGEGMLVDRARMHVTLLTDPGRAALLEALTACRQAKPGDILVVFLAGHGVAKDDVYHYLTADSEDGGLKTPEERARALSSADLVDAIKSIHATKKVLILDTCASGNIVKALAGSRGATASQTRALDLVKDRTGMYVLAGCAADNVSYESPQYGQGLLTYSLLLGMQGESLREGGLVDVGPLFEYASNKVPYLAGDLGCVQQPNVSSPPGGSYYIGRLTEESRRKVPVEPPRPRMSRPALMDDVAKWDKLKLSDRTVAQLRDESIAKNGPLYFVDGAEVVDAYQIAGSYVTKGGTTKVTFKLHRGIEWESEWIEVEGTLDALPKLVVDGAKAKLPRKAR